MPSHSGLSIGAIVSYPFAENTYIAHLAGSDSCVVVDPGLEPNKIVDYLKQHKLTPAIILNTHGHSDHIAGNGVMKQMWPDAPLVIGAGDAPKLTDPELNLSAPFGLPLVSPPADRCVVHGDTIEAAGFKFEVREAPGHCCGHVVFVWHDHSPKIVLGGDVLFQHGIGRSDFPDGNLEQLLNSIRTQLFTLPDDTIVLPGHGEATTVGEERENNPYVGENAM